MIVKRLLNNNPITNVLRVYITQKLFSSCGNDTDDIEGDTDDIEGDEDTVIMSSFLLSINKSFKLLFVL